MDPIISDLGIPTGLAGWWTHRHSSNKSCKYTEAQFEQVLGNWSNVLRQARYAQRQLPSITNRYSYH